MMLIVVSLSIAFAQPPTDEEGKPKTSDHKLTLQGHTKEQAKDLREVLVVLYEDPMHTNSWVEVAKGVSDKKGEFKFELDLYSRYMVEVAKGGFSSKKVTFDTDVYEEGNKKHDFEFIIDMVPDDGFAYLGPVANVFFHTKKHEFDYELDYSKEEQDEWERQERERLEQLELQRIAAEKKAEEQMQAKELIENEAQVMETRIQEAIELGQGDKERIIQKFTEIFPEKDTLRERKALAMYDEYIAETVTRGKTKAQVDYNSLFKVAQKVEKEAKEEYEAKVAAEQEKIRQQKLEARRLEEEALEKKKELEQIEMKDKLAKAEAEEQARKEREEKQTIDNWMSAIDRGGSDKRAAVAEIAKTFPKDDSYREEKALAIYEEYERMRQTGQTKANMNFKSLFDAAERAELVAKEKEREDTKTQQAAKFDELVQKMENRKQKEEQEAIKKIEDAIQAHAGDKEKLVSAFERTFDSNDKFKREKAEAMYAQYEKDRSLPSQSGTATKQSFTRGEIVDELKKTFSPGDPNREQNAEKLYDKYIAEKANIAKNENNRSAAVAALVRSFPGDETMKEEKANALFDMYVKESELKKSGRTYASVNYKSLFSAAEKAEKDALEEARAEKEKAEAERQELIHKSFESKRESLDQKREEVAQVSEKVHEAEKGKQKLKKYSAIRDAFEKGGGDADATVKELMKTFPPGTEYPEEKAVAMYEQHMKNIEQYKGGSKTAGIDYESLFSAADRVELEQLQKAYEAKRADQVQQQEARRQDIQKQQEDILAAKTEETKKEIAAYEEQIAVASADNKSTEQILAEAKAKEEAEAKEKAKREEFSELISLGNDAADSKLYEEAKVFYAEASLIYPQESFPKDKIKEMDRLIAKAEADEAAKLAKAQKEEEARIAKEEAKIAKEKADEAARLAKEQAAEEARLAKLAEEEKQYNKLMTNAQHAMEFENYDEAKQMYNQALDLKPDDSVAKAKIEEIGRLVKEKREAELAAAEAAKKEEIKKGQYDKLISEADVALANNYLQEAKNLYTEASDLYPELNTPKAKLTEVEGLIVADNERKAREAKAAAELAAKKEEYNALTKEGDTFYSRAEYEKAKVKYQEAGRILPDEAYHKTKIKETEDRIVELALKDAQYGDLIADADGALKSKFLEKAKDLYQKANQVKPTESYPKEQIEKVDEMIRLEKAAEDERKRKEREAQIAAREKDYKNYITKADNAMSGGQYEIAIQAYKDASSTKPEESYPKEKLAEAEKLLARELAVADSLAKLLSAQERQAKFDALLAQLSQQEADESKRREAFLSQLARIYPEGLTEERVDAAEYTLFRFVYNEGGKVTVYEKKVWNWGGQFHFKNSDIPITEELFKLGVQNFQDK